MKIRTLNADEIEVRVGTAKENGCSLLLYKDARCDMRILDEMFGVFGWEREHQIINNNLFCTVRIWDSEKSRWVTKQDVGTESMAEKEKGQASDAFKRACFNIGVGRELYTAPFIWINLKEGETYKQNNGKFGVKTTFSVSHIECDDKKEIVDLQIKDNKGEVRFSMKGNKTNSNKKEDPKEEEPKTEKKDNNQNVKILKCEDCGAEITYKVYNYTKEKLNKALCFNCQKKIAESKGA